MSITTAPLTPPACLLLLLCDVFSLTGMELGKPWIHLETRVEEVWFHKDKNFGVSSGFALVNIRALQKYENWAMRVPART